MTDREFNVQVMETDAQWTSGLHSRLRVSLDGLSLFVNPVFDSWLVFEDWKSGASDIVVDECGQTYWTVLESSAVPRDARVWNLLRHNPITCELESVLSFAGCGRIEPRKLWLSTEYLLIFDETDSAETERNNEWFDCADRHNGRVLALSRENSQIVHEIFVEGLIDLDFDKRGFVYTLVNDNGERQICPYSISSDRVGKMECFVLEQWREPVSIAVGPNGILYVLDTALGRFIRFDPDKKEETRLSALKEDLLKGFKPSAMQIDDRGVIFLASSSEPEKPAALHMFDADGSYLGEVELPSSVKSVSGIGFDRNGGVYLATDQGLARFNLARNPVGQAGVFYSRTLDNGHVESLWHRVALQGRIPDKTSVEVHYYASDNQSLKDAYDRALTGTGSVEEKVERIESLLKNDWSGPETFTGAQAHESGPSILEASKAEALANPDLILNPNKGRFLWLKLKLITFDEKSRPSIRSARVYYPRLSYLRYLPPAYREDPASAAFLERFLSMFETVFEGLDHKIDELFRYFDPRLTPEEFLPWLGSWINLSLDDDVPEDRVRRFIRRAPHLYSRKGTPEALIEFLEIYTGRPVFLTEHSRGLKPLVLGAPDFKLGRGTLLLGTGPKGMRVGDTTVVGHAAVRDRIGDADEPFRPLARRFTLVIDIDPEEFQRREATLQRIVTEQKPAHTSCILRAISSQGTVGAAVLGISGTITDTRPYRVGVTPLGVGSSVAKGPRALLLERGAWIGSRKRL